VCCLHIVAVQYIRIRIQSCVIQLFDAPLQSCDDRGGSPGLPAGWPYRSAGPIYPHRLGNLARHPHVSIFTQGRQAPILITHFFQVVIGPLGGRFGGVICWSLGWKLRSRLAWHGMAPLLVLFSCLCTRGQRRMRTWMSGLGLSRPVRELKIIELGTDNGKMTKMSSASARCAPCGVEMSLTFDGLCWMI
jgi:hypothetical protein